MRNHPTAPPRIAPGVISAKDIGQDSPASSLPSACRPSSAAKYFFAAQTVATPPSTAKIHQGKASWRGWPCSSSCCFSNIATARDGVSVIALMAEMIIADEMTRANCRKNCPVTPGTNTLGRKTELSTSVMAMIGPVISAIARIVASLGL